MVEFALASPLDKPDPALIAQRAPQLAGDGWQGEPPTPDIAVFGVGVVNPGYPLLEHAPIYAKGIEQIMGEIQQQQGENRPPGAVLAGVCNHFWVAGDGTEPNYQEQRQFARRLTAACLSIGPAKLNLAKAKVLVAGGPQEYQAIRALLRPAGANILELTTLITDDNTAARLSEEMHV